MFLIALSAAILAIWSYLLLFHGGFWRASERLVVSPEPAQFPAVAAIIPARNEAASIGAVIASHMETDYPGAFSITVVDDQSSDGTAAIAKAAAKNPGRALQIERAPPLPPGWTGKLAAQNAGIGIARESEPNAKYYLLTDADIVHAPSALRRLVAKAEDEDLALASLMARLDARGFWGGLLIPAFVYFFQKLYPFPLVNNPHSLIAAAAGGCILVRRDAMEAIGGIQSIKGELIDDCALAKKIKGASHNAKIWLGLATAEVTSLRDNRSLKSIWEMVSRTAFTQLKHSWLLLIGTVIGMTAVYLAPPAIVIAYPWHGNATAAALAGAAWIAMTVSYFPTARLYGLTGWNMPFLPVAAVLYTAMTISSGVKHLLGRGGRWKGRTY